MKLLAAILCLSASALAQGVRYDHRVATIATNYPPGAQVPVMAIPNAQVTLCVDGNCGTKAAIFSNQTLNVPTSNPMQADGQGNFGFWAAPGNYFYKVVEPSGKVNGIYPITLGSGGSGVFAAEVNGVPLLVPTPANFVNSSSVLFTNPSEGVIQATALTDLAMQVIPPVAGQNVVIYPTAVTNILGTCGGGGAVTADTLSGTFQIFGSCPVSNNQWGATWSGFALPSYVNPANVTAVYPVSIASIPASKIVPNVNIPGGVINCTDGTHSASLYNGAPQSFPLKQFSALMSGAVGSGISSVSCTGYVNAAATAFGGQMELDVPAIALVVYYTGPPPPVNSAISIVPPLNYTTATNSLGIDVTWPFPGLNLQAKTVSTLPPASIYTNTLYLIKDGASSTDCTTGGGTTAVECISNGSIWAAFASGTGGGGSVGTAGQLQMRGSTAGSFAASAATDSGTAFTISEPTTINDGTGKAGAIQLLAGTAPSAAPANTVQINAPTSVTPYAINLPGAQPTAGNTFFSCTAANPAVCSWAAASGGTGVTSFAAPSASWPAWLVPTVTNSTSTPSLAVAASAIPNTALANPSTTVNGTTCTLGSTCTVSASGGGGIPFVATTGPVNAMVATFSPAITSLTTGLVIAILPNNTNTATATLNVNGLGAKNITNFTVAAVAGQLIPSIPALLIYNGSSWDLQNPQGQLTVMPGSVGAPAYSFASGSSYGMFLGSGSIHFSVGGSDAIQIGGPQQFSVLAGGNSVFTGDIFSTSGNITLGNCLTTNTSSLGNRIISAAGPCATTTNGGLALANTQTTVSCSTSGSVVFSQPAQGTSYKQVMIWANACNGTASYTFPTAFAHTPQVLSQSLAAIATTVSISAVTITGSTSTGFLELDGF